ncbi:biotin transporter BioY [Deinococcus sp. Arct2-2]|uniref:biotin transporter BioY n=1 Tax=Deinococcus sp. Arct2-2 TaxID=2568653 RepID=UPI0010A4B714|nr:biotin transporter BioY [Deinococcus sp. Arct2-2]THF67681.1 biotin transporter BioY [Deinococcus sp. Arct2-2]
MTHTAPVFPTLAQTLAPSRSITRDIALIVGGAAFVGLLAQVEIPLQPVPLTLQTLGVLLVGAALGWKRAFAALALYVVAGAVGLPMFAGGSAGLYAPTGKLRASLGYLLSYPFAAALVGVLVQRYALDRKFLGTCLAMLAGSVVIYAFGLPGLGILTGLKGNALFTAGLTPFLIGDTLKLLLAALLLPAAWAFVGRKS